MLAELFTISPEWSATFLLVLARLSAAIVAIPLFGARGVPPQAKIGLALMLSLVRNAVGVPQLPPNQVLLGIAFLLTVFVMAPVWKQVNEQALQPYLAGEKSQSEAMREAERPVRKFMLAQTRESDLELFVSLSSEERPQTVDDVPTYVVIPSFIVSELKTAFLMGFIIFVPFLVIDIIVSSALLSMGMMMLPPVVVSLPFKILLFVLVDGWGLIIGSLVSSFVV